MTRLPVGGRELPTREPSREKTTRLLRGESMKNLDPYAPFACFLHRCATLLMPLWNDGSV